MTAKLSTPTTSPKICSSVKPESLERYYWLVRSHLTDFAGGMANAGVTSEVGAAQAFSTKARRTRSSE